jgi:hypothetical protein
MENLTINVSKQMDGFTFSISPLTRQNIQAEFPAANPVPSIFVAFDVKSDFELLHDKIEKYIYPALTGIPEKNRDSVEVVRFIDPMTKRELYHISSSHVA